MSTSCTRWSPSSSAPAERRSARELPIAGGLVGTGHALRALPARGRAQPDLWRPWLAPDGDRGLERRDEPGGRGGKGESVWLAWFMAEVLQGMAEMADLLGRPDLSQTYQQDRKALVQRVEEFAWDGEWYLRATFDDGTPLGSSANTEARIDSLPQSWAWLSGAADRTAPSKALESAWSHLVREDEGWCCSLILRSIQRSHRPDTSRDTRRVCGRTAASTPTPPSGWPWPWRAAGTAPARRRSCACSTRSSTPAIRNRSGVTGSSPTWSRPTSTACPGGSARAAGPGIRVRRHGCTAPGWRRSWD